MKSSLKVILCYALAIAVMIGVIAMVYRGTTGGKEPITYGDIMDHFHNEEVATYKLNYNKNTITYRLFIKDASGNFLDTTGKPVAFPTDDEGNTIYTLPEGTTE